MIAELGSAGEIRKLPIEQLFASLRVLQQKRQNEMEGDEHKSQGLDTTNRISSKSVQNQTLPKVLTFSVFGMTDMFEDDDIRSFDSKLSFGTGRSCSSSVSSIVSRKDMDLLDSDHEYVSGNPQELCPFFIRGACRFRKNCRLSHNIGLFCPHCGEDLPQRWTQQSKHLKRCWEDQVCAEEAEQSKGLECQICAVDVMGTNKLFALLSDCDHTLCIDCTSPECSSAQFVGCIECPVCQTQSDAVIPRDRKVFDSERKLKMFGLLRKKLIKQMLE